MAEVETTPEAVEAAPPTPPVATPDDWKLKRNRSVAFVIAFLIFVFDQATKWVVTYPLNLENQPGQTISITSFFDLHWVENTGVSLGLLSAGSEGGRWLLVAMTAGIALFVAIWLWRERRRDDSIALAMILGGALGNILDRVRFGYVVDFADLHFGEWRPFLVFNVADAAITIGVLLLLVRALLMRDGKDKKKEA
ncbi:signal peptidase II [Sphingosinicella sp. LHD-64]|uniref:signal peptidase II n=1 Tax=Sphingosinicella sp. LHD-64 TaxID=3072139 RepID=UPI00280FA0B1|nr:signal peptidase II [Sphingosinicella sp. LHD-64]MDQ8755689.1 signal peptidase II [Sphingosinicella sp. LHD-64]